MLPADRCYPKPLRAPAPRRFPCDVRGGLAPPTPCLESPVFHDTETHRRGSAALFGGGISSSARALGPSSGRPCRATHSRSRPSRGRAGMPLRVGRGPSWAPPRSLPPSIREDRRLSRSGTPSIGEHPSRVFLRACGFAATARPLVVSFPLRDESRRSQTPGHTARRFPSTRCFVRSDDAHRLLQCD